VRKIINGFQGRYYFCSNFYPNYVTYEHIVYPDNEHAYQAAKTLSTTERIRIAKLETPGQAKKEGRKLLLRSDWEEIKLEVMKEIVLIKFMSSEILTGLLLSTGDAELIEGNWWKDIYWGVYNGKGENHLGIILMNTREILFRGKYCA
jgi:ribA/ribD-fused uncharacterized protein